MTTIYSLVSVPINAALDERISIGIVMSDGVRSKIAFSDPKLNAVKRIISQERTLLLKKYIKSLEKEVNHGEQPHLFSEGNKAPAPWLNVQYLSYLSRYSNNLINFSAPKAIDIEFNEENFYKIFEKYIYKFEQEKNVETHDRQEKSVLSDVREYLFPRISQNVNLDITLQPKDFENLLVPISVDFFGKNGVPVAGQTFDFDKQSHHLENDITRYVSLTKALDFENRSNGKYFVLGREPKNGHNRSLWSHIRESGFLEFVPVNELERVEQYIKDKGVQPYF